MSEPTGHTIDGTPWEEPRGPHLPGQVERAWTRIPRPAWIFIVAAVVNAVWQTRIDDQLPFHDLAGLDAGLLALWVIARAPSVVVCLIGAALFTRHPRAWITERALVYGSILFVAAEYFDLLTRLLQSWDMSASWFAFDPTFGDSSPPWGLALYTVGAILTIAAITAIAVGLRIESAWRSNPRTTAAIWILAAATAGANLAYYPISLEGATYEWFFVAFFAAGTITTTIAILAWSYLATVAAAGARIGERPPRAWVVAALGAVAIVLATLISSVVTLASLALLDRLGTQPDWTMPLAYIASFVRVAGFIALLSAFALGLPSEDEPAG